MSLCDSMHCRECERLAAFAQASWYAHFLGYVGAVNGAHPDGMECRPSSAVKYPGDNKGSDWLLFW
jgi:hypothetical protein